MSIPQTRAEARDTEPVSFTDELTSASADFLPLNVRRILYVIALVGAVVAPGVAIVAPEWSAAIMTASSTLAAAALGTALANPSR